MHALGDLCGFLWHAKQLWRYSSWSFSAKATQVHGSVSGDSWDKEREDKDKTHEHRNPLVRVVTFRFGQWHSACTESFARFRFSVQSSDSSFGERSSLYFYIVDQRGTVSVPEDRFRRFRFWKTGSDGSGFWFRLGSCLVPGRTCTRNVG